MKHHLNPEKEFARELTLLKNDYFKSNNIDQFGTPLLRLKTAIFFLALIILFVLYLCYIHWIIFFAVTIAMGFVQAGIGFNVMHDAGHGSYSKNKNVNIILFHSLNFLGGNSKFWEIKHNRLHHIHTNEPEDDDLHIPLMRAHSSQEWKWYHRYQHYYGPFILYGITYLSWIYYGDFRKYFSGRVGPTTINMTVGDHFNFWISKLVHIGFFIGLPTWIVGFPLAILGYVISSIVCGFVIAYTFQLAHLVKETSDTSLSLERTVHQIQTTANFSTGNKVISFFCGGLNFQVEHHLFYNVSHVHYPGLNKKVKELCVKYQMLYTEKKAQFEYKENDGLFKAIRSHFRKMKELGRPEPSHNPILV